MKTLPVLVLVLVLSTTTPSLGSEDELRLVQHLFNGYNELIRPVANMSEKVKVSVQLALHQLIHVDEKNQILKSNVWIRMTWIDIQLKWDAAEYAGITVIRMQPEKVWKPDIVLFNNADGKYEVSYKPNVVIYDSGKILWIPPAIYKSSCTINVEYFPFDQQICEMKLGSWTFNSDQVILDWYEGQEKVDLEDYAPSGAWDLIACPGTISNQEKDGVHQISVVTYYLKIRRKTLFYTINLIIPCVLITFLSVCVFYLPSDAVQKMTLCISILLALVVFLVLVSKILPPTSDNIPLLSMYLLFAFIINIFTIFITVIIINWNFRSPRSHPMPRWVRVIFINYLPRMILMKRPRHNERLAKKPYALRHERVRPNTGNGHAKSRSGRSYGHEKDWLFADKSTVFDIHGDYDVRVQEETNIPNVPMTAETHKAMEAIRFIAAHLKNEDDFSEILDDWRYVASVIDRLMFFIFLGITIGGTIGILINAPHIFEYVDQEKVIEAIKRSKDGYANETISSLHY